MAVKSYFKSITLSYIDSWYPSLIENSVILYISPPLIARVGRLKSHVFPSFLFLEHFTNAFQGFVHKNFTLSHFLL